MTLLSHLKSVSQYNVRTFKQRPLAELSGSLGDMGTLLPLMIAMTLKGSIDLGSTLVFSGLANVFSGIFFGVPLPVQPMKAIAAIAISQGFNKEETAAAGLTVGIAVLVLSATGLLRWLHRIVPVPVVKGIQVAAGLSLAISAGSSLLKPLDWTRPAWDNKIWAIVAFIFLLLTTLLPRIPYALIVVIIGLIVAAMVPTQSTGSDGRFDAGIWHPAPFVPRRPAWRTGAIEAAIPQLPLTTLNSILAVTSLSASLFPTFPPAPSTTALGISVGLANLAGCWFGAMPVCHGSGGLAGQYRFGARSGASIVLLGLVKLLLGLFVGAPVIPLLRRFPHCLLGIMVVAAGVELAKVGQSVDEVHDLWGRADGDDAEAERSRQRGHDWEEREARDRWMVMLVTVAGCLAFKNDAVGFVAGLVWHWGLRVPEWMQHLRQGRSYKQSRQDGNEESQGLLAVNPDAPEGRV